MIIYDFFILKRHLNQMEGMQVWMAHDRYRASRKGRLASSRKFRVHCEMHFRAKDHDSSSVDCTASGTDRGISTERGDIHVDDRRGLDAIFRGDKFEAGRKSGFPHLA